MPEGEGEPRAGEGVPLSRRDAEALPLGVDSAVPVYLPEVVLERAGAGEDVVVAVPFARSGNPGLAVVEPVAKGEGVELGVGVGVSPFPRREGLTDPVAVADTVPENVGEAEGELVAMPLGENEAVALGQGVPAGEAVSVGEGEKVRVVQGVALSVGEAVVVAVVQGLAVEEGVADWVVLRVGEAEEEGQVEAEREGCPERLGERDFPALRDREGEAVGDRVAEGLREPLLVPEIVEVTLGERVIPGEAVPEGEGRTREAVGCSCVAVTEGEPAAKAPPLP